MNRLLVVSLALLAVLALPFVSAADPQRISLTDCKLSSSSILACGGTVTASCDASVNYGDVVVAEVTYTIGGDSFDASLTSGTTTSGVWSYTYTVENENDDPDFEGAYIRASGPTASGVQSCSSDGPGDPVDTNSCKINWGTPTSAGSSCECTYTTTAGTPNSDNEATFTRTPSAGCEDQSTTTWTDFKDFCDPQWTADYGACTNGTAIKSYVAKNPSCRANGNDIWFNHNTGSDKTPPIDSGTEVSCNIAEHNQYQQDQENSGQLPTSSNISQLRNPQEITASSVSRHQPIVGDFDSDGVTDTIAFSQNAVRWYTSDGTSVSSVSISVTGQPAYFKQQDRLLVPNGNTLRIYDLSSGSIILDESRVFDGTGGLQEGLVQGVTCAENGQCYFATRPNGGNAQSYANSIGPALAIVSEEISAVYTGCGILDWTCWTSVTNIQSTPNPPAYTSVSGDDQVVWPMKRTVNGADNAVLFITQPDLDPLQRYTLHSETFDGGFNASQQLSYTTRGSPAVENNNVYWSFQEDITSGGETDLYLGAYRAGLKTYSQYTNENLGTTSVTPNVIWFNTRDQQTNNEGISNVALLDNGGTNLPAVTTSTKKLTRQIGGSTAFDTPQLLRTGDSSSRLGNVNGDREVSPDGRYVYYTTNSAYPGGARFLVYDTAIDGNVGGILLETASSTQSPSSTSNIVVDVENDRAYVWAASSSNTFGRVNVLDISDPTNPTRVLEGIASRQVTILQAAGGAAIYHINDPDNNARAIQLITDSNDLELYSGVRWDTPGEVVRLSADWLNESIGGISTTSVWYGGNPPANTADIEELPFDRMPHLGAFNMPPSDGDFAPKYLVFEPDNQFQSSLRGNSRLVEITGFEPVTAESAFGACQDFYPLYYNSDAFILGVKLDVTTDDAIDPTDGPVLAYCDYSDTDNPVVQSLFQHVPASAYSGNLNDADFYMARPAVTVHSNEKLYDGEQVDVTVALGDGLNDVSGPDVMTFSIDTDREFGVSTQGETVTAHVFAPDLSGEQTYAIPYKPRHYVTSGDVNGDGRTDLITPSGAFLFQSAFSNVGPVQSGFGFSGFQAQDVRSTNTAVDETAIPTDINADGALDLITMYPTQPYFKMFQSRLAASALQQGDLAINSFTCSVRPGSNIVDARLLTTAPDPDSISVQFDRGDGTGYRSYPTQVDGQYEIRYQNAGDYSLTVEVNGDVKDSCDVTIDAAQTEACKIGEDGEFNYQDALRDRGWTINQGATDVSPTNGAFSSTISDVEYFLSDCNYEEVTVEFGVYPGRNGGVYITGDNGGTAEMQFQESNNAIVNEEGQRIGDFPSADKITMRFVLNLESANIAYYIDGSTTPAYAKPLNDFTLESVGIFDRIAVDYVRISKTQEVSTGEDTQAPEDTLEGNPAPLANCNATELKESTDIDIRMSAPNVRAYCNDIGECSFNELRKVISNEPQCTKEAYNYCTSTTTDGIAGGTQCATLLAAGSITSQVGFPVVGGIWELITQNILVSLIILLIVVVTIPIWIKRRR